MKNIRLTLLSLALAAFGSAHAGKTLDTIKQRDQVVVGVSTGVPGFSAADSQGRWSGLDVDIARAVAAAALALIDGRRALVYSRIRVNELDPSETDFDRTRRQQQVVQATLDEACADIGDACHGYVCDLRDTDGIAALAETVALELPKPKAP